ncbi:MAG: cyclic-di-AMP receptor [Marvinbryantia sp.]|jgi:uncharacterized protein YaaQ
MKLIYAIVSHDDSDQVIAELNKNGYQATKISSTGGFLRKGNATLMICTDDEKMDHVVKLIQEVCGERKTIEVHTPYVNYSGTGHNPSMFCNTLKQKVEVGGAVVFAVDVCYYNKI